MDNTITFKRLNSIYSDMEGINVLQDLVGDNTELQNYIVSEVENQHYDIHYSPVPDAKNRTIAEGNKYFRDLVHNLSKELRLRNMQQEANDVDSYVIGDIETGELPYKRMTEKQYIRSLRERRVSKALELGMNKTNAKALSLVIEQLCLELYI